MGLFSSVLLPKTKVLEPLPEYQSQTQLLNIQNDHTLEEQQLRLIKLGSEPLVDVKLLYVLCKASPFLALIDHLLSRLFWDPQKVAVHRQFFHLITAIFSLKCCAHGKQKAIYVLAIGYLLQLWLLACAYVRYRLIMRDLYSRELTLKNVTYTVHDLSINLNKLKFLWFQKSYKLLIICAFYSCCANCVSHSVSKTEYFLLFISFHSNWFQTMTAFI